MHLIEEKLQELSALCRRFAVRRLTVFGSAVRESFDPATSDLDFVVEFDRREDLRPTKQFFGLMQGLEQLFGRPVDLLEREAMRNCFIKASIEASERAVYES